MKQLFYAIVLLLSLSLISQENDNQNSDLYTNLRFHLIDVEAGLSNNFVNSIEQDSLGFIWIGTADGLNRYDGRSFKIFNNKKSEGLSDNNISKIHFNKLNQSLFISNDKGLNIYNPKNETFSFFSESKIITNHVIGDFEIDHKGNVIISTLREDEGLYIISEKETISSYHYNSNENALSDNEISSIAFQNDSTVWIGTFHSGVNIMNYKNKAFQKINFSEEQLSQTINTIYVDGDDNIWVGSKNGLSVITSNKDTLFLNKTLDFEKGLSDGNVLCFAEDNYNRIWVGTRNGGLNIIDKTSLFSGKIENTIKWFLPKSDGSSVFNRTISSIKKDNNGNMWLGTSNGVNYVNPDGDPIKVLLNQENLNTISHNRVASLAKSKDNKIWIGTDGGGLDLLDLTNDNIIHFKHSETQSNSLSNNYVISVLEDSKGRVWAGTYQGGLNLVSIANKTSKKYLYNVDVRVIFEDSRQQIWIGTNRGGLFKYNEKNDTFDYVNIFGNLDIRDIKEGEKNTLWLATFGDGIIWFDQINNEALFYNTKNTEGLLTDVYFSVLPLNNGKVLLGSRYQGLFILNPETKNIVSYTSDDGLSSNSISSIIKDKNNLIWLGTSKGLNRIDLSNNSIIDLSGVINLKPKEFAVGAVLKHNNGSLFFGSNKGLHIIYPDRIGSFENRNPLIFKNIAVYNEEIRPNSAQNEEIIDQSISYEDEVIFKHNHKLFSLEFGVLQYPFANNIKYSYRLKEEQYDWIEINNSTVANFSNTPQGDYTLEVRAKMATGETLFREISLVVLPPFWLTGPAYILYFVVISVIVFFIIKYYSDRIRLKTQLLFEQKQRILEHDLNEERMHFFTSFSHELKTPLTLILAPLDDLLESIKSTKSKKKIKLIQKNANFLHASINKLLEFRKSELGLSKLSIQQINLHELLQTITSNFKGLANSKKIKLSLNLPKEEVFIWADLEKMHIILNNLVSNALQHTDKNGKVTLKLEKRNTNIIIWVKDTGEGIAEEDLPNIFNWYYKSGAIKRKKGSGVGLALTRSFVKLHGGKITAKNNEDSTGAVFNLVIPMHQKDASFIKVEQSNQKNYKITDIPLSSKVNSKEMKLDEQRELILVVDDNEDIVEYIKDLLKPNYDIVVAYNGEQGISKAKKYIPNLIVSDIMMPEKSGIDLCDNLKNNDSTSHIPIILLTAKQGNESIKSGYQHGADAYISKPFDKGVLISRIENLISNRNALKEYFSAKNGLITLSSESNSKLLDKEKLFLQKINTIIFKQLKNEKMNISNVAEEIGMSRSSLFRKIKAITGKNINEYIRGIRIEKAMNLIKNEGLTISQASYEVGFNNVNYFRRIFKEELGMLPSSLKKTDLD